MAARTSAEVVRGAPQVKPNPFPAQMESSAQERLVSKV
jgi:hypothetical protein